MTPSAVLVLRFSAVGDVVLTGPALEALKTAWPTTRVIYCVKAPLAPLLHGSPFVDEVLPLTPDTSPLSLAREARARGVEAVLDLHGKLRSRLIRAALPGVRAVGWTKRDWRDTVPVKLGLRPYRTDVVLTARYHAAVEALVGRPLPRAPLRYASSPAAVEAARAALRQVGWASDRPLVGFSPGANWATKRWPVDRYAALAARVQAAGWQVAMAGGPDEQPLAAKLREAVPTLLDLTGTLDLGGLGAFIGLCGAFVANDSGPMHLARAQGVPTLAFFGSTTPHQFEWAGHARLFDESLPCAPCSFFGRASCPKGHFRCMEHSVDAAWAALQPLLDGRRRAPVLG